MKLEGALNQGSVSLSDMIISVLESVLWVDTLHAARTLQSDQSSCVRSANCNSLPLFRFIECSNASSESGLFQASNPRGLLTNPDTERKPALGVPQRRDSV